MEGGFRGRTNKLVDGCYSFWQGGLFPLLHSLQPEIMAQDDIPRSLQDDAVMSDPGPSRQGLVQQALHAAEFAQVISLCTGCLPSWMI